MNNSKNLSLHYLALAGFIALGAILRFWHLDLKPLWLDEVLTALLSLGGRYEDVPLDVVFPSSTLQHLFILKPQVSWAEIAQAVATQSTHPPLFFCLMHQWLNWVEPIAQPLSWKLRSLAALIGVSAIAAVYCLNRVAFSPAAGLMGAALIAVSPFGVYLSQEARHYTLPMLLITLALLGLIQIQQALYFQRQLPRPVVWLWWGVVNSIGCYVHYFFILAFIAQLLTLTGLMYWRRRMLPRGSFLAVTLVVSCVAVSYLPWLPVLLGSFGRSETSWLPKPENIAPLYQTLVALLSMVIALPVEKQPLWIQVPLALLTIGFGSWVSWQGWRGLKQLWQQPETRLATFTLSCFTLCVLLQFFAIVYLLGKDITVAPRYHFVYYPAVVAILGASLAIKGLKVRKLKVKGYAPGVTTTAVSNQSSNLQPATLQPATQIQPSTLLLSLSLLSCVFVVSNLVFLKPFHPQQVAQDMTRSPDVPIMMVVGYNNFQDVALGLSFALAIDQLNADIPKGTVSASFAFLDRKLGYELVWQKLSKLPVLAGSRLNLWVVAPGLKRRDYPLQLAIAPKGTAAAVTGQTSCTLDRTQYHRIGIPYQLYRCN
jgi:uncharacterized membrane protein